MAASLPLDAEGLSRLIGLAYDAALDPEGWTRFSQAASDSMEASLVLMLFIDHARPDRSFMVGGGGIYPDFIPRFRSQWDPEETGGFEDHLWNAVRDSQAGTVRRNHDVLTPDQIRSSRIYQQLGAPWKLENLMIGVVTNSIGASAYFTLGRPPEAQPFSSEDKRVLRENVLGHLGRSLGIHRNLDQVRTQGAMLNAVADMAPYGIVVFDRHSRPLVVNQRAERIFRGSNGLTLRGGALRCPDPATQARLDWSLGVVAAINDGAACQPPAPVPVAMPGGRSFEVVFSPLPLSSGDPDLPPAAACIALIQEGGPTSRHKTVSSAISAIYGLTPAEVRLCEALFRGQSLPEAADGLAISRNTAKTHLSRIFDKTGVRSQIALLRLLAFGPRSAPEQAG